VIRRFLLASALLGLFAHGTRGQTQGIINGGVIFGTTPAAPACGGYHGPGDLLTFVVSVGVRAYSAATCGNKSITACDAADAHCVDWVTSTTTGWVVPVTVGSTDCVATPGACTVKTLWNGPDGVAITQATIAKRAVITTNCHGETASTVCLYFDGSGGVINDYVTAALTTITQPMVFSAVGGRTGSAGVYDTLLTSDAAAPVALTFPSGGNALNLYAGSTVSLSGVTDGTIHAMNAYVNSVSSVLNVDGATQTGDAGADTAVFPAYIGDLGGSSNTFDGVFMEAGIAAGGSAGTLISLNTQQHAQYAF
jgi:hypothetical protein